MLLSPFMSILANAENDGFTLEAEQNWDTYGVGGTCVFGTHNIFVADVDGDGAMEILTGGFSYNTVNGTRFASQAPLKVWGWNGQNITLKTSTNWNGNIYCLYAADLDGDGVVEIITAGSFRNQTGNSTTALRIWQMKNGELSLKAHYEGASIASLFVADVDNDGAQEILSVGRLYSEIRNSSQLCLWKYSDSTLSLYKNASLASANVTSANSVYASDLNNDGTQEIIIGGYAGELADSKGQLSLWQWRGQELGLLANQQWQLVEGLTAKTIAGGTQGNTAVYNVKAGDLDGDGKKEVVTGGFAYDGEQVNAQIKVWRWDGDALMEKASQEWATDYLTEVKCVTLNDVDGDGKTDIVVSGITAAEGSFNNPEAAHDRGQLRVWGFDGAALVLKYSTEWSFDDGSCAWNVGSGDADNDGVVEMITIGCSALGNLCDPDMRIWSLPQTEAFPTYIVYVVAVVLIASGTSVFVLMVYKRRKSKVML
jgi:hypothetical protein